MKYKFKSHVFGPAFAPYYDAYKGHLFVIDHTHSDDANHVWLTCITNPSIKVDGYVEMQDLSCVNSVKTKKI